MLKYCWRGRGMRGRGGQPMPAGRSLPPPLLPLRSHLENRDVPGDPVPPHVQQKVMEGEIQKGGKLVCLRFMRCEDTLQHPAQQQGLLVFLSWLAGWLVCEEGLCGPSLRTQTQRLRWDTAQRGFRHHCLPSAPLSLKEVTRKSLIHLIRQRWGHGGLCPYQLNTWLCHCGTK